MCGPSCLRVQWRSLSSVGLSIGRSRMVLDGQTIQRRPGTIPKAPRSVVLDGPLIKETELVVSNAPLDDWRPIPKALAPLRVQDLEPLEPTTTLRCGCGLECVATLFRPIDRGLAPAPKPRSDPMSDEDLCRKPTLSAPQQSTPVRVRGVWVTSFPSSSEGANLMSFLDGFSVWCLLSHLRFEPRVV